MIVLDELDNTINGIGNSHPTVRIFLGGDFNASDIDRQQKSLATSYVPVPFGEKLPSISEDFHLEQLISYYTHKGTNILDLFSNSHLDLVMSCQTTLV